MEGNKHQSCFKGRKRNGDRSFSNVARKMRMKRKSASSRNCRKVDGRFRIIDDGDVVDEIAK